jgi:hypothetical protein
MDWLLSFAFPFVERLFLKLAQKPQMRKIGRGRECGEREDDC